MRWRDVQHQDRALSLLKRGLAAGRTAHAYLFDGPEGVGKELAARVLAARLLCRDVAPPGPALFGDAPADDDACGRCEACLLLAAGNHPDFHLIHRGLHKLHPERTIRNSRGLTLSVEVVRHFLIDPAGLKPTVGSRRIFVIRDAERMHDAAQNALLKTLEEPPGAAVLVLVTASAERLLPTIRSRCQRVPFGRLPRAFIAAQLATQARVPAPAAEALAGLADGRLGPALRWHKLDLLGMVPDVLRLVAERRAANPEPFGKRIVELAEELGTRLTTGDADDSDAGDADGNGGARGRSRDLATDVLRDAFKLVLLLIAAAYRDALLAHVGARPALCLLAAHAPATKQLAARCSAEACQDAIRAVAAAEEMLDRNVAPQLAGEHLAVTLG